MRSYERLFYAYYRWARKINGDIIPESTSILALTTVVWLNFGAFRRVAVMGLGWVPPAFMQSNDFGYILGFGLYLANYIMLGTKARLASIVERYEGEGENEKNRWSIVAAFTAAETLIVALYVLWAI